MAFAWPRPGRPPLVFDQSSSASSRGRIQLRLRDGKPIPEGWAIDEEGRPTTDPAAGLAGAQLPFGGYKGSNIAMMIELLAGCLAGGLFSYEVTERTEDPDLPTMGGEFMIAIDPGIASGAGDRNRVAVHAEGLFARILEQDGARLPSDRRHEARARTQREGIAIPGSLHETLLALRGGLGARR
jgi:LDH2 family malate/lactate/ureidoglycolate dehydrogenase